MDKERRSCLKRVVTEARRVVEEDVRVQLRRFGFEESGKVRPVDELPHLSRDDRELRDKILKAVEKEKISGISDHEAFDRYVRHVGFTYVNRIAALRAMEVRKLIKETVLGRDVYGGRSLREYEIAEREGIVDPYRLLKASLIEAFREISTEIKVLFDVNSEYSLVFLGHKVLLELIRLLSEEVPEEDWKEDDIIGWIYQYFNDEAREEYRRAKRRPLPDDIPLITQFYTPYWIVKALVDNTLGKLWLEMNPASQLAEFCTYLLPSNNGKLKSRTPKSVREIKILDPACGSGHFLVYAFDVLYRMYMEEEPNIQESKIPALILKNNLHGIDIDLRAVQLAALSLYLKAKKHNSHLKIERINLICADVRIRDGKNVKEFLDRFEDDPDLQRIFQRLFQELSYTFEIGSLLKVRGPFEVLFRERSARSGRQARLSFRIGGQTRLADQGLKGQAKFTSGQNAESKFAIVVPKERTIEEMLEDLNAFEAEAFEAKDIGRLLFATETEKSIGLLALLCNKYDVVLMNPPLGGDVPKRTKEYLKKYFPKTHHNLYAAFMEQAIDLLENDGYVGAPVGRSFMFLRWYTWVREELLRKRSTIEIVWDLGLGVFDVARHSWTAFTARKTRSSTNREILFFRLTEEPDEDAKREKWEEMLQAQLEAKKHPQVYKSTFGSLSTIPRTPFAYWTSDSIRESFRKSPPLDCNVARKKTMPKISDVKVGLQTGDDAKFTRFWWEVPTDQITTRREETYQEKKWVPFANEVLLFYFYDDVQRVVNWENDGYELRAFPRAVVRNNSFYFKPGLTWSVSINKSQLKRVREIQRIPVRVLPEGCIFGIASHGIFAERNKIWSILSLVCSTFFFYLSRLMAPEQMPGTGSLALLPTALTFDSENATTKRIESLAKEAHDLIREWTTGDEISTIFIKPWIIQVLHGLDPSEKPNTLHPLVGKFEWSELPTAKKIKRICGNADMSLSQLAELCIYRERMLKGRVDQIQKDIDEEIYGIYEITAEDRALIERELTVHQDLRSKELPRTISVREHIERLISCYVTKAIESDEDGIVPLNEMFPDNLFKKVRELIAQDLGKSKVDEVELEILEILGKPLKQWLAEDYFGFHVSLYRRRPIFWHLTSSNFARARGSTGAFNCFLRYHKLDRDTIPKARMNCLRPEVERAKWKVDRLKKELREARDANDKRKERRSSEELDSALSILEELQNFQKALEEVHNPRKEKTKLPKNARWVDQKIAEVRDNGYNPVIDYGVRVNIEPLKEAGLLHKAARRVK